MWQCPQKNLWLEGLYLSPKTCIVISYFLCFIPFEDIPILYTCYQKAVAQHSSYSVSAAVPLPGFPSNYWHSFFSHFRCNFFLLRNRRDATKWFAGSATPSSAGSVKNALILRVRTYISTTLLPSVTIFCFMECHFQMMRMIGGRLQVSFLKMMTMTETVTLFFFGYI